MQHRKKVIERHTRRGFITFNQLPGNWHLEIHELPHAKGPYGLAPKILGSKGLLAQVPLDCRADRQWPGLLASRYLYLYLYLRCRQRTACGANLFLLRPIRVLRLLLPPPGCQDSRTQGYGATWIPASS